MKNTGILLGILAVFALPFGTAVSAQDEDELRGTAWQLVSIGDEIVVNGTTLTLVFGEDDRASGSSGCNYYDVTYSVEADEIDFDMPLRTLLYCGGEGVMEQEQSYLNALETASSYEITGERLVILCGDGQRLVFESAITLACTSWKLVSLGDVAVMDTVTLMFGDDGFAFGSSVCSSYQTTYITRNDSLIFTPVLRERAVCSDEAHSELENAYFEGLETTRGYEMVDDRLTITNVRGEQFVFTTIPKIETEAATVTVEVTYRERIVLSPEAEITIQLLNVSIRDVPAEVVVAETITADGVWIPFVFKLPFDSDEIVEGNRYAVQVEIRVDGELLFMADQNYAVTTEDNLNVVTIQLMMAD